MQLPIRPPKATRAALHLWCVPPQEQAVHLRVGQDFGCGFVQHQATRFQRDGVVRVLERALDVLLDHQHRGALVGQFAQQLEHVLHHHGRQANRGLVDQYDLGTQEQRAANLQLLLLTARKRGRTRVQALLDAREELQHFGDAFVRGLHAQRDAAKFEVLVHRQLAKKVAALRHKGNALRQQCLLRGAADVLAVQADLALARLEQAEQSLEHGGLARAVGADQQRDGAGLNTERQVVQDHEILVTSDHVVEFDAGCACRVHVSSPGRRRAPVCWNGFLRACRWPGLCPRPSP